MRNTAIRVNAETQTVYPVESDFPRPHQTHTCTTPQRRPVSELPPYQMGSEKTRSQHGFRGAQQKQASLARLLEGDCESFASKTTFPSTKPGALRENCETHAAQNQNMFPTNDRISTAAFRNTQCN